LPPIFKKVIKGPKRGGPEKWTHRSWHPNLLRVTLVGEK
jgi:hypothetical protein